MNQLRDWLISDQSANAQERLCSTSDGFMETFFSVFENSPNGTVLGKLDIIGNTQGDDKNIDLRLDGKGAMCGEKLCESWIYFDDVTQTLSLRVDDDVMLDNDGQHGVDFIEVSIFCSAPITNIYDVAIIVTIKVEDVNDNDPLFVGEPYVISVNEMTSVGTSIFNVTSSDLDKVSHRSYYVIPGSTASDYFAINSPSSGEIKLTQKLDFETMTQPLELGVEVRDVGRHLTGDTRTMKTMVTIKVEDGDDQPPAFEPCTKVAGKCVNPVYKTTINRFARSNKVLVLEPAQLYAVDPDLQIRQTIKYSLLAVNPEGLESYFTVEPSTGGVRLRRSLPETGIPEDIEVFVQASQSDNERMSAIATVQIHVQGRMSVSTKPEILTTNLTQVQAVVNSIDDLSLVRTLAGNIVQIQVKGDSANINFMLDDSPFFEISPSGFVLAKNQEILQQNARNFVIKVRVENTKASGNDTRYSDTLFLRVEILVNTTLSIGCSEPVTNVIDSMTCISALGVFVALFILCIPVIILLIVKMRRYKARSADVSKQPYVLSQSFGKKYDGFGYLNNSGFKDDSTSFASSVLSHKQSLESGLDRYGHMIKAPAVDDEVPHIAPLDAMNNSGKSKKENVAAIIPYQHSTPTPRVQGWELEQIKHPIDFSQIRIEQWLQEEEEEKSERSGVGEVNLGSPRSCFVKIYTGSFKNKKSISRDVMTMSDVVHDQSCAHPNIVKFFGACVEKKSLYVIQEYVASSDLRNFLISSRMLDHSAVISTLSGSQLTNFVIGICDGLSFLHENDVVHGGLCAKNVRINDRLVPKISGCCAEGGGRWRCKSQRWAAPEYLASKIYNDKSDIWSLAVVAWEILSLGGTPFAETTDEKIPSFVQRQLDTGGSLFPVTRNTTKRLWMLLQSCWSEKPQDRPQVESVLSRLKKMKETSNAITVARPPGYRFFPTSSQ
uniref:uncharacterized protein LOC100183460 isoform X2 n=1 Tax=Ciona intestinalis TaxID=7719 RepID=UPI000EF4D6E1|nr:uncharacterized protein LOC100183460 isoform X2 [Ciona intestinalis]|eukprot:XP_026693639.1 uncharacterized protein LOC100183460 isoform X2 [Ciona intestinalis]